MWSNKFSLFRSSLQVICNMQMVNLTSGKAKTSVENRIHLAGYSQTLTMQTAPRFNIDDWKNCNERRKSQWWWRCGKGPDNPDSAISSEQRTLIIDLCSLQTIRLKYKITNEHLTEVIYYLKIVRVVFAYQELKFVCVLLSFQFTILNNWL